MKSNCITFSILWDDIRRDFYSNQINTTEDEQKAHGHRVKD